jgi:hypothetical protein
MNIASFFCWSQLRKFDVHDSQKMSISQKLAMIDPVRMRRTTASRFLADK